MNVGCAWCGRMISESGPEAPISHGICADCVSKLDADAVPVAAFLETLAGPVMLVDAEVRAIGANSRLADAVRRERSSLTQRLGGEIIACVHSSLPGGCGRTEHCAGCAIRQAVEHTRLTGEPAVGIPVYATVTGNDGPVRVSFTLSLERVGSESVLVRIDAASSEPCQSVPPTAERGDQRGLKIVVADDDAGVRGFLARVLRRAGCLVFECANGREATREALAQSVDVVITDLVMPEQEGIETMRELRNRRPALAIIAISGAFSGTMLRAAKLLGAKATLEKPITAQQLLDAVQRVAATRSESSRTE